MAQDDSLLDPEFARELESLRRRLEIRARSGALGERTAKRRGGTAEFEEHRPYVPGDDLRRVDWLAFARTGAPVVKLFRTDEDAVVRLLLDGSASLDYGSPPKFEVVRRLAAAVGYVALTGCQRVQVLVTQTQGGSGTDQGAGLSTIHPPRRGRGALVGLLRDLAAAPRGRADLARAIDHAIRHSERPGMLVLLSDFLDAGPVTAALGRARSAGHDIALVHVLDRAELQPPFEGDATLVDSETGASVNVTVDASALEAYALRLAGLVEELRAWARQHGATYVRATTDEPLEQVIRRFVGRSLD
jgi:uncharacterized protein (DUF58 family)